MFSGVLGLADGARPDLHTTLCGVGDGTRPDLHTTLCDLHTVSDVTRPDRSGTKNFTLRWGTEFCAGTKRCA